MRIGFSSRFNLKNTFLLIGHMLDSDRTFLPAGLFIIIGPYLQTLVLEGKKRRGKKISGKNVRSEVEYNEATERIKMSVLIA